jgi:hypothetical protein
MPRYQIPRAARAACIALVILASLLSDALATDYTPLIGRWQRTDGGYVLEIGRVAPNGSLVAGYFNPRPINVSYAEASLFKGRIKVDVELRDKGYPGSAYTLIYDPERDTLFGIYHHATSGQNFEVVFVRVRPAN